MPGQWHLRRHRLEGAAPLRSRPVAVTVAGVRAAVSRVRVGAGRKRRRHGVNVVAAARPTVAAVLGCRTAVGTRRPMRGLAAAEARARAVRVDGKLRLERSGVVQSGPTSRQTNTSGRRSRSDSTATGTSRTMSYVPGCLFYNPSARLTYNAFWRPGRRRGP